MMSIECPNCKATYRIEEPKIDEMGVYATCRTCRHRLLIRRKPKHDVEEGGQIPELRHPKEDENSRPVHDKPSEETTGLAETVHGKPRGRLRLAAGVFFLGLMIFTGYFIVNHLKEQERVSETNSEEADLREADLRTANLQGMKLKGANLWRSDLSGVQLLKADLAGAYLCEANLQEANLLQSNLERVALPKANLQGAILRNANLEGADLPDANLKEGDLRDANLKGAFMKGADLRGANLKRTDLRKVWGLTVEQLSKVKTLYQALLRPELLEQIKRHYPHLLEMPSDEGEAQGSRVK